MRLSHLATERRQHRYVRQLDQVNWTMKTWLSLPNWKKRILGSVTVLQSPVVWKSALIRIDTAAVQSSTQIISRTESQSTDWTPREAHAAALESVDQGTIRDVLACHFRTAVSKYVLKSRSASLSLYVPLSNLTGASRSRHWIHIESHMCQ